MLFLDTFEFSALWSPYFMVFIASLAVIYLLAVGRYRRLFAGAEPVKLIRKASFLGGLFCIYAAHGSPIDLMGHLMFSAHMTSMSLAYLIAPPLIYIGTPDWLLRPLMKRIFAGKGRMLFHPILMLLLFNSLFSFYHIPLIHDHIMTNYVLHTLYYVALYAAAFLMWWPIAGPLPEYSRMTDLKKMGYVFANGALLTPACALIIFSGTPLYATYSDPQVWAEALGYCVPGDASVFLMQFQGPDFFALMKPIHDQQLGGVIMKLVQELMYSSILFYIFSKWFRSENPKEPLEPEEEAELLLEHGGLNRA